MKRIIAVIWLCAVLPTGLDARAEEPAPGDAPVSLEEWRDLTRGRTVWYMIDGALWGREYYHPDRDTATFVTAAGECVTAPWVYANGLYCFSYVGLQCFRHFRRDGALMVAPLGGGGAQVVGRIDDAPLSCEPPLSS